MGKWTVVLFDAADLVFSQPLRVLCLYRYTLCHSRYHNWNSNIRSTLVGGKKRSQNVRAQIRSKKRAKLSYTFPQVRSAIKSFDERVKTLMGYSFKEKFGHCLWCTYTPRKKSGKGEYQSLGVVCGAMIWGRPTRRSKRERLQVFKRTQDNIRQLEGAAFKLILSTKFDERLAPELMKYKKNEGHCNVRKSKSKSKSRYSSRLQYGAAIWERHTRRSK